MRTICQRPLCAAARRPRRVQVAGPALLAFSDGRYVGAILDRNGLRPARYCLTSDGLLYLSSEVGVNDVPIETVIKKVSRFFVLDDRCCEATEKSKMGRKRGSKTPRRLLLAATAEHSGLRLSSIVMPAAARRRGTTMAKHADARSRLPLAYMRAIDEHRNLGQRPESGGSLAETNRLAKRAFAESNRLAAKI